MNKIIGAVISVLIAIFGGLFAYLKGKKAGAENAENANLKADNEVLNSEIQSFAKATKIDNSFNNTTVDSDVERLRDFTKN